MAAKTGVELQEVFKKAKQSVREKAKLVGAPLYYMHNGKRIREDVDGKKYVIVVDSEGIPSEFIVE